VPRVGFYQVKVWLEGDTAPIVTGQFVEVRKAFPSVHFYDERTGQRYTLKGEVIPPKEPKPPKPPTERRKRKLAPQPEREASTERVSEVVPAVVAQRAPDAELVELRKKFEDERQRLTKERTDLLATISREQTLRRDLEQMLLRATSIPKPPARDDGSSRLRAAEKRALDAQIKELRQSLSQLQGRVTELEKDKAGLTKERDKLKEERDALKLANATRASQIITLEDRAKEAESDRTELTATLPAVERPRDELASTPPNQAAPAATAVPSATAAPAATADAATADAGAASTPPSSPTGVVIHRLAFGGNLPPASSPKTGLPSLGILGQNHRSPIRGGANKKHKRR
jgi:hypothetical protein